MKKNRIILTVLFCVLSVAWMMVIFGFSSNDAEESTEQSHGVTKFVLGIIVPGFDDMSESEQEELIAKYDRPVRKTAHFASYALLGCLLYLSFGCLKWLPERNAIPMTLSLPVCVMFALSDEYHQTFVAGRAGRFSDVLIDSAGACCGTLFAIIVVCVLAKYGCLKSAKKADNDNGTR